MIPEQILGKSGLVKLRRWSGEDVEGGSFVAKKGISENSICQDIAKRSRTGGGLGSDRVGLGTMTQSLGRIRGVEGLG